jgi:hypothetical protein
MERECNQYELNVEVPTSELVSNWNWSQNGTSSKTIKRLVPKWNTQKKEDKTNIAVSSSSIKTRSKPSASPAQLAAFAEFYKPYPLHKGRAAAEKEWLALDPDSELTAKIMAGAARYAEETADTEAKHIKHPGGWLKDKRWEDETEQQPVATEAFING